MVAMILLKVTLYMLSRLALVLCGPREYWNSSYTVQDVLGSIFSHYVFLAKI